MNYKSKKQLVGDDVDRLIKQCISGKKSQIRDALTQAYLEGKLDYHRGICSGMKRSH